MGALLDLETADRAVKNSRIAYMQNYIERKGAERGKSYWRQVAETIVASVLIGGVIIVLALLGVIH